MDPMPIDLHWTDVLIRVGLSLVADGLIGFDRSESGKTAGLRTTILVCLAACLSMLQVNALLVQAGKPDGGFATLDLMRLPLGILTGMGFIGGGAILHRDGLVSGVTTAATLWFVTVVGLCIGGGQLSLGMLGLLLGLAVVWPLRFVEQRLRRVRTALITIEYDTGSPARERLVAKLRDAGIACRIKSFRETAAHTLREEELFVQWRELADDDAMLREVVAIAESAGLNAIRCSTHN
ncbi:MgtC/SapB family protein [Burkholderia dolosa]|uniref:MgtC/SapB family protein n=1 Tax=Burkholderia dolosa TaxID=152500 RepID=UPI001BA1C50B|nr:MgtC/SapB family protein [Burkholderia dolosa]MBR8457894.1 MgtC/SapB family protein [Burkholderia dolosa]MDN7422548.1 MgtC/SapB family protein [Burkholderia dolosa]